MKAYILELYQNEISSWRVVYYNQNNEFSGCEEFDSLQEASNSKEEWETITEKSA
jgi:hypothetical protein